MVFAAAASAKGKLTAFGVPDSSTRATSARLSARSTPSGFSQNTVLPASIAARACSLCAAGGQAM